MFPAGITAEPPSGAASTAAAISPPPQPAAAAAAAAAAPVASRSTAQARGSPVTGREGAGASLDRARSTHAQPSAGTGKAQCTSFKKTNRNILFSGLVFPLAWGNLAFEGARLSLTTAVAPVHLLTFRKILVYLPGWDAAPAAQHRLTFGRELLSAAGCVARPIPAAKDKMHISELGGKTHQLLCVFFPLMSSIL